MESDKDIEEHNALTSVLKAHHEYGNWATSEIIKPRTLKFESLSKKEKDLIPWFPQHLESLKHSILMNQTFTKEVANTVAAQWGADAQNPESWFNCSSSDLDKVRSILIQYTREWSDIGAQERDLSFGRILKECEELYPDVEQRQNLNILVPGCGLARLVVEFVKRGFRCQGNEFSYHMLINSSFILNCTSMANEHMIFPFIHKFSHVAKRNDQLRQVFIPDFFPGDISFLNLKYPNIPVGELMSMAAGSFVDLYGPPGLGTFSGTYTENPEASSFRLQNKESFDVLASCFFLDTASNIIEYLEAIHHCLKKDGYWINFGPLLWHYENDDNVDLNTRVDEGGNRVNIPTPLKGLELTRDDLISLIKDMGFVFKKHESGIRTTYGGDDKSLGGWVYDCEFWVCQKA